MDTPLANGHDKHMSLASIPVSYRRTESPTSPRVSLVNGSKRRRLSWDGSQSRPSSAPHTLMSAAPDSPSVCPPPRRSRRTTHDHDESHTEDIDGLKPPTKEPQQAQPLFPYDDEDTARSKIQQLYPDIARRITDDTIVEFATYFCRIFKHENPVAHLNEGPIFQSIKFWQAMGRALHRIYTHDNTIPILHTVGMLRDFLLALHRAASVFIFMEFKLGTCPPDRRDSGSTHTASQDAEVPLVFDTFFAALEWLSRLDRHFNGSSDAEDVCGVGPTLLLAKQENLADAAVWTAVLWAINSMLSRLDVLPAAAQALSSCLALAIWILGEAPHAPLEDDDGANKALRKILTSLDSVLVPLLGKKQPLNLSRIDRVQLLDQFTCLVEEGLLRRPHTDFEHFVRLEIMSKLSWRGQDAQNGEGLTSTSATLRTLIADCQPVLLTQIWSLMNATKLVHSEDPPCQNFGIYLAAHIINTLVSPEQDPCGFQSSRSLYTTLTQTLLDAGFFTAVFQAPNPATTLRMPEMTAVLKYMSQSAPFVTHLLPLIWDTMQQNRNPGVQCQCVALLRSIVDGLPRNVLLCLVSFYAHKDVQDLVRLPVQLLADCSKHLRAGLDRMCDDAVNELINVVRRLLGRLHTIPESLYMARPKVEHADRLKECVSGLWLDVVRQKFLSKELSTLVKQLSHDAIENSNDGAGSTAGLLYLLEKFTTRVLDEMTPSGLMAIVLQSFREFVQHNQDSDPTPILLQGMKLRVHVILLCVKLQEPPEVESVTSQIWNLIVGPCAVRGLPPSVALCVWMEAAAASTELAQGLAKAIQEDQIAFPHDTTSVIFPDLFAILSESTQFEAALQAFLVIVLEAIFSDEAVPMARRLLQVVNDYMFSKNIYEIPTLQRTIHSLVASTCLEAFLASKMKAGSVLLSLVAENKKRKWLAHAQARCVRFPASTPGSIMPTRVFAPADAVDTLTIRLFLRFHTDSDRAESWVLEREATVDTFHRRLQDVFGFGRIRVFHSGQLLDLVNQPERSLKALPRLDLHFIADCVDYGGLSPYDKSIRPSGDAMEEEIVAVRGRLSECLDQNDDDKRSHLAFLILSETTVPDEGDATQLEGIEQAFERKPDQSVWKTCHAIDLVRRTFLHYKLRNVQDPELIKKRVRQLCQILIDYHLEPLIVKGAVSLLRDLLMESCDEEVRSTFFEDDDATCEVFLALIHNYWQRVTGIESTPVLESPFGEILACFFEVALVSDGIALRLGTDSTISMLISELILDARGRIGAVVALVIGQQVLPMPDMHGEKEICGPHESPQDMDHLKRGTLIKETIAAVTMGLLTQARHDPTAAAWVYDLGKAVFFALPDWELALCDPQAQFDSLYQHLMELGAPKTLARPQGEQRFGCVCFMIEHHANNLFRRRGACLKVTDEQRRVLLSSLFYHAHFQKSETRLGHVNGDWARRSVYAVLLALSPKRHDTIPLLQSMYGLLDDFSWDSGTWQGRDQLLRAQGCVVGLENQSMTCYLNSLLQQLYMNVDFRSFILSVGISDESKQQVLVEIQTTFRYMAESKRAAYRPEGLAKVLEIDVTLQEDVQLFFTMLMSRLEDEMPDENTKNDCKSFYYGTERTQTRGECGHVSDTSEEFLNLSLTVKGLDALHESLSAYVEGEQMTEANKFRCSQCEKLGKDPLVGAMRRTRFERIPDNLVVGLKRFQYELESADKINDYFEYPATIDMAPYTIGTALEGQRPEEPDVFELVGVIIHQGSLTYGHYWTYVKSHSSCGDIGGKWFCIEDSISKLVDLKTVLEEGRGGTSSHRYSLERSDNAYVLFYRRRANQALPNGHIERMRDAKNSTLEDMVTFDNETAIDTADVFNIWCQRYIAKLLTLEQDDCLCNDCGRRYDQSVLHLSILYLVKVAVHIEPNDNNPDQLGLLCDFMMAHMRKNTILVSPFLKSMADLHLDAVLFTSRMDARSKLAGLMFQSMRIMSVVEPVVYGTASPLPRMVNDGDPYLVLVLEATVDRLHDALRRKYPIRSFFDFVQSFASLGPVENNLIAWSDFPTVAIKLLLSTKLHGLRDEWPEMAAHMAARRSIPWDSIISFLHFCVTHLLDVEEKADGRGKAKDREPRQNSLGNFCIEPLNGQWMLLKSSYSNRGKPSLRLLAAVCTLPERPREEHIANWPTLRFLVYMTSQIANRQYANDLVVSLAVELGAAQTEEPFARYLLVAKHLVRCGDCTVVQKIMLLRAVMDEAGCGEYWGREAISWLEAVANFIPNESVEVLDRRGSSQVHTPVDLFLLQLATLLFNESGSVREATERILHRLASSSSVVRGSLADMMRADVTVFTILKEIRSCLDRLVFRRLFVRARSGAIAYFRLTELMATRYESEWSCVEGQGPDALEAMLDDRELTADVKRSIILSLQELGRCVEFAGTCRGIAKRGEQEMAGKREKGRKRSSGEVDADSSESEVEFIETRGKRSPSVEATDDAEQSELWLNEEEDLDEIPDLADQEHEFDREFDHGHTIWAREESDDEGEDSAYDEDLP